MNWKQYILINSTFQLLKCLSGQIFALSKYVALVIKDQMINFGSHFAILLKVLQLNF